MRIRVLGTQCTRALNILFNPLVRDDLPVGEAREVVVLVSRNASPRSSRVAIEMVDTGDVEQLRKGSSDPRSGIVLIRNSIRPDFGDELFDLARRPRIVDVPEGLGKDRCATPDRNPERLFGSVHGVHEHSRALAVLSRAYTIHAIHRQP